MERNCFNIVKTRYTKLTVNWTQVTSMRNSHGLLSLLCQFPLPPPARGSRFCPCSPLCVVQFVVLKVAVLIQLRWHFTVVLSSISLIFGGLEHLFLKHTFKSFAQDCFCCFWFLHSFRYTAGFALTSSYWLC